MGRIVPHAWALLVLPALLWPLGCGRKDKQRSLEGVPVVRVRLMANEPVVTLTASRSPTAWPGSARQRRLELPRNTAVPLKHTATGWLVGDLSIGGTGGELTIQPDGDGTVSINGVAYRGRYRFVPSAAPATPPTAIPAGATAPAPSTQPVSGGFDVINDVDIDSYLKSVVSKELLWNWHDEAYRAQAIVARTYALYQWAATGGTGTFDLYDDVRSQVYGGIRAESGKSREAVDATARVVLAHKTDDGYRIFKAYFSACCGGITQSAADVFNEPYVRPLSARYVGPLCNASPRFNWGPVVLTKADVTRRLRIWGKLRQHPLKDVGEVTSIEVLGSNEFGRPTRFLVTDAAGTRFALTGEEIRWAINSAGVVLNSSFFKPVNEQDVIRFAEGHGWGHGVGMCQWCAQGMAEDGAPHEVIVLNSFPGAKLVRAY
jgi:stage II sporulation protein D